MLLLAPKLSEKTINNQLLKYFAKLQMDQEVLYGGSVYFLLNTLTPVGLWSGFHLIVEKNPKSNSSLSTMASFSIIVGRVHQPKLLEYFMFCSHGWFTIMVLSMFRITSISFLFVYIHVEERLCSISNNLS